MITINIDSQYVLNKPMNGDAFDAEMQIKVDLLRSYVSNLYVYGISPKTSNRITTVILTGDAESDFDMDHFWLAMSFPNTTVNGIWPTVKILTSEMSSPTPVGLVQSLISEQLVYSESGEDIIETIPSRQKTWYEWANLDGNYNATIVENYTYFGAHFCAVDGGRALTSNELMLIQNDPNAELVEKMPIIE